jgi:hypothetical protein
LVDDGRLGEEEKEGRLEEENEDRLDEKEDRPDENDDLLDENEAPKRGAGWMTGC